MYICDICEISFVCLDEIGKTNKKVSTGHFAECNTRQRGTLPSVKTIALGKEPRPGHRYRFFAECSGSGTRQRTTLCRVSYQALDKVSNRRDPSGGFFAECCQAGTRQSELLCRVSPGTLGKDFVSVTRRRNGCFSLPSAREKVLGKDGFADALYAEPSLSSVAWDTRQRLRLRHPSP
jgi:hypothetical protein